MDNIHFLEKFSPHYAFKDFVHHPDLIRPIIRNIRRFAETYEENTMRTKFNMLFGGTPTAFRNSHFTCLFTMFAIVILALLPVGKANAQSSSQYSLQEVVDAGHGFFQSTSGHIATAIERVFAKRGQPNGYILGEEASGAFIGGLRYGEGVLYTKNAGDHKLYWQGPSVGWDYGADGNRTMILVYNLPDINSIYRRYFGVSGSAYLVGGIGVTALTNRGVHLVPIRTGIGARLGVNVGYLKIRSTPRINPF